MLFTIIILLGGFILLIKGADFFVEGSSSIAGRLRVPNLIIGLTLVAMGTSFPELSVSVVASVNGSNSLSISNAVGSNIFNFMMVLGITAIIAPIAVEREVLKRDFPVSIICALGLLLTGVINGGMPRIYGIMSLVLFIIYLLSMVISARKARAENSEDSEDVIIQPLWKSIIFVLGGVCAIKFGGDWVVESAVKIATALGVSETLIGLTIVSVGTSLPELVTSVVAAGKGKIEMAVGNAVGSNIFNLLLILGVASSISPIPMIKENIFDTVFLAVVSIVGFIFCKTRGKLERREGLVLVIAYAMYLVYIVIR